MTELARGYDVLSVVGVEVHRRADPRLLRAIRELGSSRPSCSR